MKKPKHSNTSSPYRKIADFAMVGSSSALVLVALLGCDNPQDGFVNSPSTQGSQAPSQAIKQGAFVIVEEQLDGSYKVLEEYPSATTRVVVRDKNGVERILSDEEVDAIIQKEAARVENGTSELLAPAANAGGESGGGLGLGGAILASAAGALLGSYIGNKLFNNPNYQQNKQRTYKSPQAYERSANNFKQGSANSPRAGGTPSNAKGGFYQNNAAKGAPSTRPAQGGFGS
ncbi:hypothetical protein HMPREF2087_00950 [Helicobacter canis NCTC 12740]|uniref:UPF0323 domain-containing protein n=2 Tax=Helicobacter canis TaxID=29419 RepID=V8CGP3_9HELI|nr:UPF0323 family lipoprotein [Helicobacter canis]ETD26568.1 hypothetical protein HMPREF2087_00950 [Helicobacter canis NCTC 12740]